jgi:hypothetical protein
MEKIEIIEALKLALENMNKEYCKLSNIDYKKIELTTPLIDSLKKEKYLERPFAYEFYHQLRKLIDKGDLDFGGPIIQAEVDKTYQHCFKNGKVPDFIIHIPDFKENLIVLEFKLATSPKKEIKEDFIKIVEFKRSQILKYSYGVEVIIGTKSSLITRRKDVNEWNKTGGEEIIIIEFDTESWKADHLVIKFKE